MQISCPVRLQISFDFLLISKHSVALTNFTYCLSYFTVSNFKPLYSGFLLGCIFDACHVRSFLLLAFFLISMKMNMHNTLKNLFRYLLHIFVCVIWRLISISSIFYLLFEMKYVK